MGNYYSTHEPIPEDDSPTPNGVNRLAARFLAVDPRSPSTDISRTPIVIEKSQKTPDSRAFLDPRSPSTQIARTPIVLDKEAVNEWVDPRSPTVGIARTPLNAGTLANKEETVEEASNEACKQVSASAVEAFKVGRQGNRLPAKKISPSKRVVPQPIRDYDSFIRSMDFPDSDLMTYKQQLVFDDLEMPQDNEMSELVARAIDTIGETTEQMSLSDLQAGESETLINIEDMQQLARQKKMKKVAAQRARQLFPTKSGVSSAGEVTRSPLSTRIHDVNSPRNLVQRKQKKDVDKFITCPSDGTITDSIYHTTKTHLTCAQENVVTAYEISRDKENYE